MDFLNSTVIGAFIGGSITFKSGDLQNTPFAAIWSANIFNILSAGYDYYNGYVSQKKKLVEFKDGDYSKKFIVEETVTDGDQNFYKLFATGFSVASYVLDYYFKGKGFTENTIFYAGSAIGYGAAIAFPILEEVGLVDNSMRGSSRWIKGCKTLT